MVTKTERAWPDVAIPPGETLAETLAARRMSQAELARRMGRPEQALSEIVNGAKEITPETAIQLARALGVPAHVWLGLESQYRYVRARLEDQTRLKDEAALAKRYPHGDMVKLGWVPPADDPVDRAAALLDFFGVHSLRNVEAMYQPAWRRTPTRGASREALAAWLRQGERLAQAVATRPFDEASLTAALPDLRAMTQQRPEAFERRLKSRLAECGVALVLVPHLPRTGANGATRWLGAEKALVQMSLRYPWDDVFWFNLFHEVGHVLLHARREVFIETDSGDEEDERERQANTFAGDALLQRDRYQAFVRSGEWRSARSVAGFANAVGVAPSIVVGRLQHDRVLSFMHLNGLRRRFRWARSAHQ